MELLEGEAGGLDDDVVEGGLEGGGGGAGDVVAQFVEGEADGEEGGDFGDGEAGGLGGEGGGARDAGVHLDDDAAAGAGIDAPLDVGAAGGDADGAHDGEGVVAHGLVFGVGEGLDGGDGDGVAGVNAHGVDVLDGADDDGVALAVADDLHLELLPAQERFLDEDLGGGRGVEPGQRDALQGLGPLGDAAAGAAEGEGRADDERPGADGLGGGAGLGKGVGGAGAREIQADGKHGFLELLAILGALDAGGVGADHLHAEPPEGAAAVERHRQVEGRLAAEGGQEGVGALALEDGLEALGREGLNVGAVGGGRVGHDGGRVGVHEDDLVALGAEGLAGLRAGVVELAPLADDDGPRADEEDLAQVGAFRHGWPPDGRGRRPGGPRRAGAARAGGT